MSSVSATPHPTIYGPFIVEEEPVLDIQTQYREKSEIVLN